MHDAEDVGEVDSRHLPKATNYGVEKDGIKERKKEKRKSKGGHKYIYRLGDWSRKRLLYCIVLHCTYMYVHIKKPLLGKSSALILQNFMFILNWPIE